MIKTDKERKNTCSSSPLVPSSAPQENYNTLPLTDNSKVPLCFPKIAVLIRRSEHAATPVKKVPSSGVDEGGRRRRLRLTSISRKEKKTCRRSATSWRSNPPILSSLPCSDLSSSTFCPNTCSTTTGATARMPKTRRCQRSSQAAEQRPWRATRSRTWPPTCPRPTDRGCCGCGGCWRR